MRITFVDWDHRSYERSFRDCKFDVTKVINTDGSCFFVTIDIANNNSGKGPFYQKDCCKLRLELEPHELQTFLMSIVYGEEFKENNEE